MVTSTELTTRDCTVLTVRSIRCYLCFSISSVTFYVGGMVMLASYVSQDEKELLDNNCCPIHLKSCIQRKEDNYFFALSKYQKQLEETLTHNPNFVQPTFRLNEVRISEILFLCFTSYNFIYMLHY